MSPISHPEAGRSTVASNQQREAERPGRVDAVFASRQGPQLDRCRQASELVARALAREIH